MSDFLLGFESKKERDDALIALIVLLLFGWAIYHFGGYCRSELPLEVPQVAAAVVIQDRDGDGIEDVKDVCPDIAGLIENKGCPADTDGDGVYDTDDKCPELAGSELSDGCPSDSDGDGIYDNKDKCPKEAGSIDNDGCPMVTAEDKDGDGVPDKKDLCPEVVGTKATDGCPDTDNDGIANGKDECPEVAAGEKGINGCPDTDGDGVLDKNDKCPAIAAGANGKNGCPDTDGDGFVDKDDKCPNEASRTNRGCPDKDTDGDGVPDKRDRCPNKFGKTKTGCPEVKIEAAEKAVLDEALKGVEFASNKDLLIGQSKSILQNVAGILKKYPDYKLEISGHTDATGPDEANMTLSQMRADATKAFLVRQGIQANRMTAKGYGETKPVGDNKTLIGRKANRRVEFKLKY